MTTFTGAFVPVAPPADGLRLAFVAARRRRSKKAGAAGAATVLSVVVVLASGGGAGNRTLLQEPLPPAHAPLNGVSAPAARPESTRPTTPPVAPEVAFASHSLSRERATGPGPAPAVLERTAVANRSAGGTLHPTSAPMTRGYTYNTGGSDLICPARKQQQGQRGLCADVTAYTVTTGVLRLTAEICNFDARAATLDYATERELDISIRRGATEVWRWSAGRRFASTPHELAVGVGECVVWTTDWAQNDSRGRAVQKGMYDVVAEFEAAQLPAPDRHASYSTTLS
jgi:hypothetical protein